MVFYILLFIFGLIFGSFLNVVIYRLPLGQDIVKKRSYCPRCGKTLKWHELIPVLSFFILGGKCAGCKAKLSWQYPLVEVIAGLIWVLVFYKVFGSLGFNAWDLFRISDFGFRILNFFYDVFILSSLLTVAVIDAGKMIIPDKIIYPAILAAFLYNLFIGGFWIPLVAASIAFSAFYLIIFFSKGRAMGLGDAKLAFLMGLFLGFPAILVAFWWAFILGASFGIILIAAGRKNLSSQLPFGPFLAAGTLIAYFLPWQTFFELILTFII